MRHFILYNPLAGHCHVDSEIDLLRSHVDGECILIDVTREDGYKDSLSDLHPEDVITVSGGDGTLNKFINTVDVDNIPCDVYYYGSGSGNDFMHCITDGKFSKTPVKINKYLYGLPTVFVNGKSYRFINGIGFGLDGYCCPRGDEKKEKGKKVDYTMIAIFGLLFKYKPRDAKVLVDGKEYRFNKVTIAPSMHGRFYGGGMMPTPNQDRFSGKLSFMALHDSGRIRTLSIFPSIFKGEHVKHQDVVTILEGREITVEFDTPCALQIDGETVREVKSYTVKAY
jgi:diacylglycerol kinase family enzyme